MPAGSDLTLSRRLRLTLNQRLRGWYCDRADAGTSTWVARVTDGTPT